MDWSKVVKVLTDEAGILIARGMNAEAAIVLAFASALNQGIRYEPVTQARDLGEIPF